MASYVLGFKTDGGIPLFSRAKGNIAPVSFETFTVFNIILVTPNKFNMK